MPIATEQHPYVVCLIEANENQTEFVGTLSYRGFESGRLTGDNLEAVRKQFQAICCLLDNDGGMLRRGTIMLGYHNNVLKGDVLLPDGEIVGYWEMENDDDWCHFTEDGQKERLLSAPSAWMLQDTIADWLEQRDNEG